MCKENPSITLPHKNIAGKNVINENVVLVVVGKVKEVVLFKESSLASDRKTISLISFK